MSAVSIEAPYAVASLPRPFDQEHGRIYASPVHSIQGSRKRKRHEIAAAIDGEAVNIYNVQSQSLTTSYALPPQTFLCCQPCSIYRKSTPKERAQRQTYLVLKENAHSLKRRLVCFTEKARSKRKDAEVPTPAKSQCEVSGGDILRLDVLPGGTNNRCSLIVNYANGDIQLASDDLSKTHHEPASRAVDAPAYRVDYAVILDIDSAAKGILRGREDVVAQITSATVLPAGSHLLFRIAQIDQQRRLELYTLRDPLQTGLQTSQAALQLVMEYDLSFAGRPSPSATRYDLHAASGTLYQLLNGKLSVIDLSCTIPKLVTKFGSDLRPINNFCQVSSSSVLTFTTDKATVFESSFGSIQASASMFPSQSSGLNSRKQKYTEDDRDLSPFTAVCAYTDIGLVIGISGQEIMAMQLNGSIQRNKSARATGTLLRDTNWNSGVKNSDDQEKSGKKRRNWQAWTAEVDRLVDVDDMEGLENLVANDKEFGRQRKVEESEEGDHSVDGDDVDAITYRELWPLPEAFDPQDVEKRKALYLLSKVFELDGDEGDGIHIRIPSFKLLELFALSGFLSTSYLRAVFGQDSGLSAENVKPGDIMNAINNIDDDFQFMHDLLSLPVAVEPADVMQALRIVIQSFDTSAEQEAPLALPPIPQQNGVLTNGDTDVEHKDEESHVELESKALEMELDFVVNALNSGLEVRSETIWEVTRRLSLLPRNTVTSLMRSMMPQSEIVFFIHILRIELADGGWTSKYVEDGENDGQERLMNSQVEEEQSSPNNQAIQIIAHLLSCAVDAIGTSGWLVGLSSSALGTDEIIESLKAEISAGLEGCYEAHTLRTLLTELEGHAATLEKRPPPRVESSVMQIDEGQGESSLLPLGSGAERIMRGDMYGKASKKTKKAFRMERSRNVGAYSFERIRI